MNINNPEGKGSRADPDEARISKLADLAGQGDSSAFEKLVKRYWGAIFRMAFYRTSSRADAEELTQDIFMKAYRNVSRLKDPDRFKSWLYSIGLNRIRDYYRRKQVRSIITFFSDNENQDGFPEIEDEHPMASDDLEKREFWQKVGEFTDSLPKAEREVFRLRFMDQLTLKETAEILGRNESTVKTHLYRAVGKLRGDHKLLDLLR